MNTYKIIDLRNLHGEENVGRKAINLRWMIQKNYKVPTTYVLPYQTHPNTIHGYPVIKEEVRIELEKILKAGQAYAVRSSANLEDSHHLSYAGQFKTFLNLHGSQAVSDAIVKVLSGGDSELVQSYAEKIGHDTGDLQMAVIIQEMVKPVVSGVAFSKNPLTGLDEVIVEAVLGSGEALVQEGQTPDRWVYKWGKWIEQPAETQIEMELIHEVVQHTMQISKTYGSPLDLEWVFDGQKLYWVQLRPITYLDQVNIYSNRISKDVFPGMIKPLIWSVNVPMTNTVWIQLFTRLIGDNDLQPEDLARSFAYRAYFNMGVIGRIFVMLGFPKETLELMLGYQGGDEGPRFRPSAKTMRHLPRMGAFALSLFGIGSKIMPAMKQIRANYAELLSTPIEDLDEEQLLVEIDKLFQINQKAVYFNIVVPLLMSLHNLILRKRLASIGIEFSAFDLTGGMVELGEYDPKWHIHHLATRYNLLDQTSRSSLESNINFDASDNNDLMSFHKELEGFIHQFGHLSDRGNDFSTIPWRENRPLILEMIQTEAQRQKDADCEVGDGEDDHVESIPQTTADQSEARITRESLKLNPIQRMRIKPAYQRARKFHLYRGAVGYTYSYGYGLFRNFFLEVGRRLVDHRLLDKPEDIFFLYWDEVREAVDYGIKLTEDSSLATEYQKLVSERKEELESSRGLVLPEIIYGNELPPLQNPEQPGDIFKGVPTSGGYYRGPVRVIKSVSDFGKLFDGDVLVIPYSDVGWTPLFSRAGAVIAETGGMLSHSSIVAREFNLPCVVSVPNACQIPDGIEVSVDGFKGEIYLHAE
jgi:phosphohistidine swiveling domain-containing protein